MARFINNLYSMKDYQKYLKNSSFFKENKSNDTALILLGGPDSVKWIRKNVADLSNCDIFTMSSNSLLNIPVMYYIYEPTDVNSINDTSKENLYISGALSSLSETAIHLRHNNEYRGCRPKVILSPNSSQIMEHSAWDLGSDILLIPDYYFIDEYNSNSTSSSLKKYFTTGRWKEKLLNFRCSAIRALSIAIAASYKNIKLVGLNPSSSLYWFHHDIITDELFPGAETAIKYIRAKQRITDYGNESKPHSLDYYRHDITKSQAYCINEFLAWAAKYIFVEPLNILDIVEIYSEDSMALEMAELFGTRRLFRPSTLL